MWHQFENCLAVELARSVLTRATNINNNPPSPIKTCCNEVWPFNPKHNKVLTTELSVT